MTLPLFFHMIAAKLKTISIGFSCYPPLLPEVFFFFGTRGKLERSGGVNGDGVRVCVSICSFKTLLFGPSLRRIQQQRCMQGLEV